MKGEQAVSSIAGRQSRAFRREAFVAESLACAFCSCIHARDYGRDVSRYPSIIAFVQQTSSERKRQHAAAQPRIDLSGCRRRHQRLRPLRRQQCCLVLPGLLLRRALCTNITFCFVATRTREERRELRAVRPCRASPKNAATPSRAELFDKVFIRYFRKCRAHNNGRDGRRATAKAAARTSAGIAFAR